MRFRRPPRVGFVMMPPGRGEPAAVYLMHLPDGEPTALTGTSALIWALAAEGEEDVLGALAELLGQPVGDVERSVGEYLDQLVLAGWLEGCGPTSAQRVSTMGA